MDITAEFLEGLITCPKKIVTPPKREMTIQNQCRRNNFTARSVNGSEDFCIRLRQSAILPEDFSIVLQWKSDGRNIIIFRCNGPHGGNRSIPSHFTPHVHRLNLELAAQGIFKESDTATTTEYSTFESAVRYFLLYCGIEGAGKYFPYVIQPSLFDIE